MNNMAKTLRREDQRAFDTWLIGGLKTPGLNSL